MKGGLNEYDATFQSENINEFISFTCVLLSIHLKQPLTINV